MFPSRTTETQGNHDLFEAFARAGCPVCALVTRDVARFMGATNYDSLGDPVIRQRFEASQGFCNIHAHQWLREAFILGTAQMYRDVLKVVHAETKRQSAGGKRGGLLGRGRGSEVTFAKPAANCPACEIRDETEARLLRTLLKGLAGEPFRSAYAGSDGLCLPHLRLALADAPAVAFAALRERALATEAVLLAHLEETILKHDYRFQHEPAGEEAGSAARAVAWVAGVAAATKVP